MAFRVTACIRYTCSSSFMYNISRPWQFIKNICRMLSMIKIRGFKSNRDKCHKSHITGSKGRAQQRALSGNKRERDMKVIKSVGSMQSLPRKTAQAHCSLMPDAVCLVIWYPWGEGRTRNWVDVAKGRVPLVALLFESTAPSCLEAFNAWRMLVV